ncbi:M15 family metallopeptidase [Candidatus Galacturonibacter soehngenii]|uniref:M15 family metallopeptidase n=1 Tax=Candidatus Galacturonatibacter soehngenii TaxID=2307010 RepID=A0A7V7UCK0_9FIRM|nr:M15 family metallopeptidase [Candidatus Galacturonibacter soehngenii]KAB1439760.1 M15 family metallopeptidase [Candidatus Galacturonibacter soehngenii]MBA4688524.1 M15 family metallopeptidase [Candidatus Galacturonibacter soehngenii]
MRSILVNNQMIHTGHLILVNRAHPIKAEPSKEELCKVMKIKDMLLQKEAANALQDLIEAVNMEKMIEAVSGYRTRFEQEEIYSSSLNSNGADFTSKFVALPGHSEHQTGLAIDLAKKQEDIDFICPDFPYDGEFAIFREQAAKYGFIERYQKGKEKITGISPEPWHFRYVGKYHASLITKQNMALEEYIEWVKQYKWNENPFIDTLEGKNVQIGYQSLMNQEDYKLLVPDESQILVSGNNVDGIVVIAYE